MHPLAAAIGAGGDARGIAAGLGRPSIEEEVPALTTGTPDLGALFDAHVASEFVEKDAAATMATMTEEPTVVHIPVLTGGRGSDELHAFYRDWFIPSWPDDVELATKYGGGTIPNGRSTPAAT
jgi:hypothetical protein